MKQLCNCIAALLAAATLSAHAGDNAAKAVTTTPPGPIVISIATQAPSDRGEMADAHALLLARIQPVVKDHPYSAEEIDDLLRPLADGNALSSHSVAKVYRDKDGRTRREVEQPGGTLVIITDPVAQQSYALRPAQSSALRMAGPMPRPPAPAAGATPATLVAGVNGEFKYLSQPTITALGARDIDGVAANGQSLRYEIPAGEVGNEQAIVVTTEIWHAPDLRITLFLKRNDPRQGERTVRLSEVQRQEPPPSLFTVPADYSVRDIADAGIKTNPSQP